jgi:hypothetical protein
MSLSFVSPALHGGELNARNAAARQSGRREVIHVALQHTLITSSRLERSTIMLTRMMHAFALFLQMREAAEIARRRRPELVRHFVLSA